MPFRPSSMEDSEADHRANVNLIHENPMEETAVDPPSSSSSSWSSMANEYIDYSMFDSWAPGYRFEPSDEELITYYLIPKNKDQALDEPNIIQDIALSDYTPEEIAEKYKPQAEGVWYFFAPRTQKYKTGMIRNRVAGDGHWRAVNKVDVFSNGMQIGFKTSLVFHRKGTPEAKGEKTNWIMHEFTLPLDRKRKRTVQKKYHMKLGGYVLCRIHKNTKWGPKGLRGPNKASRRSNENEKVQILPHETAPALDTQEGRDEVQHIPSVKDVSTTMHLPAPDNHSAVQQAASNGSFHGICSETHNDDGATVIGNFSCMNSSQNGLRGLSSNIFSAVPEAYDHPLQSISPDQFSFPHQTNDDDDLLGLLLNSFVDPYELSFRPTTATSSGADFNPQQANDNDFVFEGLSPFTELPVLNDNHSTFAVGQLLQIGGMWEYY